MLYMTRALARPIPGFSLPEGYVVRPVAGEHWAEQRAAVTHSAFRSAKAFEQYLTVYRQFMRSPVYPAGMDLVVFTPEGRGAACCIGWLDAVNQVGLFEPVATHPDFHRLGLGKAVVLEGLRRMKAQGMASAIVCADHDNLAAQRLYASAGFRVANSLRTFVKEI
jgi:GNAT superfamily N-acetyltransferase